MMLVIGVSMALNNGFFVINLGIDQQCTRIILLPSFAESGIVVFLNLNNLKCHTIYFPSTFF